MDKITKILVVSYSQSGQLDDIVESILKPLKEDEGIRITWEKLRTHPPFPFPWSVRRFFDVFAESVSMVPTQIETPCFKPDDHFDLVILGYTPWYLSPSIPMSSFLKSPYAQVMKQKPVVTVIGCRDMWLMAQEKVKEQLRRVGAIHVDNVALIDQGGRLATFFTMPKWLLTGEKKGSFFFPPAGVHQDEINNASRFGSAIRVHLDQNKGTVKGTMLKGLGAVKVYPNNIRFERAGRLHFQIWAALMLGAGKVSPLLRHLFVLLFVFYLGALVLVSIPFNLIFNLLINPLIKKKVLEQVRYFEKPSGP